MALKSEQARVLRRRVLGGLIRNLLLFSGAFALACLVIETFMVPSIANWVADSTSSWRTLNSSEQFQQILTDQGLLDDANLFDLWVNEAVESGCSNDAGTIAEVQGEANEMEDALAEYASMMADSPENAEAAAAYAKERAEKLGADVAVASGTNAAAIGDTSTFIDDVAPLDAETDGAPDDKTLWAVPLLPYQTILTAEGIFTDEASAAHAMAALRVSASLQELGLSLPEAQTFMPPEITVDVATRILVSAAVLGYDQPTLNDLLQSAFRQSQEQAYSAWLDLTSAEEARALGVSDDHPVWQVQYGEDGVYRMRDVATYTFVKSFKLPLALLVFVAGWLAIILRALNRSLRYFDELSGAVGRLLADKDAPIELPTDLSIARNELAVIRSQSLADERAAHAAEQRKNELVAYLAHDIRTPLTSVLGYLDLLRETTDLPRETLRKYADIAYSKAERLESLINEFFEITRYNLSAIPIERETVGGAPVLPAGGRGVLPRGRRPQHPHHRGRRRRGPVLHRSGQARPGAGQRAAQRRGLRRRELRHRHRRPPGRPHDHHHRGQPRTRDIRRPSGDHLREVLPRRRGALVEEGRCGAGARHCQGNRRGAPRRHRGGKRARRHRVHPAHSHPGGGD